MLYDTNYYFLESFKVLKYLIMQMFFVRQVLRPLEEITISYS